MKEEIIYIRSMVTPLDILHVSRALQKCGLQVKEVELGAAAFINEDEVPLRKIQAHLSEKGYRIISRSDKVFLEQVKAVIQMYMDQDEQLMDKKLLSDYLEEQLHCSYELISNRFSKIEEQSLENFYIGRKIEKIKNSMRRTEQDTPELAFKLRYGNKADISRQFKELTGQRIRTYKHKGSSSGLAFKAG